MPPIPSAEIYLQGFQVGARLFALEKLAPHIVGGQGFHSAVLGIIVMTLTLILTLCENCGCDELLVGAAGFGDV